MFPFFLMSIFKNTFELVTKSSTEIVFLVEKRSYKQYISCGKSGFSGVPFSSRILSGCRGQQGQWSTVCGLRGCSNSGNKMALKMLQDRNRHYALLLHVPSLEYISKSFQCAFSCDKCSMQRYLVLNQVANLIVPEQMLKIKRKWSVEKEYINTQPF